MTASNGERIEVQGNERAGLTDYPMAMAKRRFNPSTDEVPMSRVRVVLDS